MPKVNPSAVSAEEAARWLASGEAILINVREPDEFKAEHIACAASMPLGAVGDLFGHMQIPSNRKIIFQCLKGGRGEQAGRRVSEAASGHALYNLAGGITAWKYAGLPVTSVEQASGSGVSIFRQVQIGAGALVLLSVLTGFAGYRAGFAMAGLIGAMLIFAGASGWCGMALLLARLPWNRQPDPR